MKAKAEVVDPEELVPALREAATKDIWETKQFLAMDASRRMIEHPDRGRALVAVFGMLGTIAEKVSKGREATDPMAWMNMHSNRAGFLNLATLARDMLRGSLALSDEQLVGILHCIGKFHAMSVDWIGHLYMSNLTAYLERLQRRKGGFSENVLTGIQLVAGRLGVMGNAPERRMLARWLALLDQEPTMPVIGGEVWADRCREDVAGMNEKRASAWNALLAHCAGAKGASPSTGWLKAAAPKVKAITPANFIARTMEWFALVDKPRASPLATNSYMRSDHPLMLTDASMDILKGLCWVCGTLRDADMARSLGKLAISAYRKVPGVGPRAVKVGNAAVQSLGRMPGMDALGQLSMLRIKVKFGTAQKLIEKALNEAAEREGLPRDEIDELGVPGYGLTEVGLRREQLGEFAAQLKIEGDRCVLSFTRADGKAIKTIPAKVKDEYGEELKELRAAAKDIAAMLPAQRDRLDSLFVENKTWSYATWAERYLNHPLVGVIARRMIWQFGEGVDGPWRGAIWSEADGRMVDGRGRPVDVKGEATRVRLWHPVLVTQDEVLAWRGAIEERQIKQPFKQAHREVYLLTDAEQRTNIYSNRFAAHVIKQHQFHALAGVRNWKNKLRIMADAEFPPATRWLRAWGLRAEFWIDGAGDEYGRDTNESGAFLYLVTDQVRFYREGAAEHTSHASGGTYASRPRDGEQHQPIPLHQVPALVLSEVLRDVDLFVGVCSVGNNPAWQDGGPNGLYQDYWWKYSFGELSEAGEGRHDVLARLLPRLAIGPLCALNKKFLVVRGSLRTYKIHLGSGNILMEPNDQYLCIVPTTRSTADRAEIFLPFEGDRTLTIILSKAFMLAEDEKITDISILNQIRRE